MKVRFTPSARRQFINIVEYIRQDNPTAARAFRKRVEHSLRRLTRFPNSGRTIPEFPDLPFREVIVGAYRFFYRISGRVVWIAAAWHGAQSLSPTRMNEDE